MVAKQSTEYKDVVIVGAGISGIDSAYRLQTDTDLDYTIFEGRHEIGGTWSLFQFPGIRSDSDMFTLGFPFRPWTHRRVIADGGDICQYVKDTAHEFGIDKRIQFNCKVVGASWSSQEQRWTLTVEERLAKGKATESTPTRVRQVKTRFVTFASGYFNYAEGHYPNIPGADTFAGPIIKPQWWPEELDFKDKRVVVIGSGATAATIVPNMASRGARHVVMLQRSPTYILSIPGENHIGNLVRKFVPSHMAHSGLRAFSTLQAAVLTTASKVFPGTIRRLVMGLARHQLPKGYDVDKHFNPSYNPWDQRMCIVPDGDFYRTIKEGKSSVVTGHIAEITPLGIKLTDGQEIEADIIVQATGLKLQLIGGSQITVDGEKVKIKEHYAYKSQMLEGVPNLSMVFVSTTLTSFLKNTETL